MDIAKEVDGLNKAMSLRTYRHQVLASNIANADTPHYKARDFDFQAAMRDVEAAKARGSGLELTITAPAHLKGNQGDAGSGAVDLLYRTETQSAVDGNTVDMDVERTQITENSMQYEFLSRLISDRFQGMRTAISGNQG